MIHKGSNNIIIKIYDYIYNIVLKSNHRNSYIDHHKLVNINGNIYKADNGMFWSHTNNILLPFILFTLFYIFIKILNIKYTFNENIIIYIIIIFICIS